MARTIDRDFDWGDEAYHQFAADVFESCDDDQWSGLDSEQIRSAVALVTDKGRGTDEADPCSSDVRSQVSTASENGRDLRAIASPKFGRIANPEIAEAFLQDASRGVTAMEQAVIKYESQQDPQAQLSQICRELHTLKGAAAITGLEDLARYLHEVEELLQVPNETPPSLLIDTMLECVDVIREQVNVLSQKSGAAGKNVSHPNAELAESRTAAQDSIRVRASQLDRLMDMLAELVMLRNQRESRVDQLREIREELNRSGTRLRELESYLTTRGVDQSEQWQSNPLLEVANDLSEVGRNLRDLYEPVAAENVAVSSFIRQFRKALVSILRMPVAGLFQRLQRAALDAARVEGKQVRFDVIGSETGLERSIQERLFEPLMHIVRNAVSHGIERPDERAKSGKDPIGTLTLEAAGTPNMLVITVREDGRGLDYEALRRRGIELGMLASDRQATPQELAQLMFRPGFSTRKEANAIAGRGVGMDVVANVLQKMKSWVEVDSTPGQGTSVRLTVPLHSIIEHAMVIRSCDQLYAVPMQYVKQANKCDHDGNALSLGELLGQSQGHDQSVGKLLVLESQPLLASEDLIDGPTSAVSTQRADARITLSVDEIIGPEDVVVRPLPSLFRYQNLFAGVTLSGAGQIVLLIDPSRLIEFSSHGNRDTIQESIGDDEISAMPRCRPILVVDDSLSARRHVSLMLQRRGCESVEVSDGLAALDHLKHDQFSAVFTDFEMPGMDGLQLVRSIRRNSTLDHIPIFMISSLPATSMREKATSEGATQYVRKPITEETMDEIIEVLGLHKGGS